MGAGDAGEHAVFPTAESRTGVADPDGAVRGGIQAADGIRDTFPGGGLVDQLVAGHPHELPFCGADPDRAVRGFRHRANRADFGQIGRHGDQAEFALVKALQAARKLAGDPDPSIAGDEDRAHRVSRQAISPGPRLPLATGNAVQAIVAAAQPDRAVGVGRHAVGPDFTAPGIDPPTLAETRELAVFKSHPDTAGRIFANRTHRVRRKPGLPVDQGHDLGADLVEPAPGSADPEVSLLVLQQAVHFAVRGGDAFQAPVFHAEQPVRGGADPECPGAVFEHHPGNRLPRESGDLLSDNAVREPPHAGALANPQAARSRGADLRKFAHQAMDRLQSAIPAGSDCSPMNPSQGAIRLRDDAGVAARGSKAGFGAECPAFPVADPGQAGGKRKPDVASGIFDDRACRSGRQAITRAMDARPMAIQTNRPSALHSEPHTVAAVAEHRAHHVVANDLTGRQRNLGERIAIEAQQAGARSDPHVAITGLRQAGHAIVRQPLVGLPRAVAPLRGFLHRRCVGQCPDPDPRQDHRVEGAPCPPGESLDPGRASHRFEEYHGQWKQSHRPGWRQVVIGGFTRDMTSDSGSACQPHLAHGAFDLCQS